MPEPLVRPEPPAADPPATTLTTAATVPAASAPEVALRLGRRRWVFRGDEVAWDALMASIVRDPSAPVSWPIAATGPSVEEGDHVLLWRSGGGGGIAALCEVTDTEEPPTVGPDGRLASSVKVRVLRALPHPIPALRLAADDVLRPVAFLDLLRLSDHRLTAAQDAALDALLASWPPDAATADAADGTSRGPDADAETETAADAPSSPRRGRARLKVTVPRSLVPLVEELVAAMDPGRPAARGRATASSTARRRAAALAPDDARSVTEHLRRAFDDRPFTTAELAELLGLGAAAARGRLASLVDAGLVERAPGGGGLRAADGTPLRGRPPTRYLLVG